MSTQEKGKHGGTRQGAGRKPKENKKVQMTATVQPLTRDSIKEYCREKETRLGLVLDGMVEGGRFNPIESFGEQAIKEFNNRKELALRNAFQKHFGFPIEQVQDKENLEHIVVEGQEISSFRYRGETFLYWKDEMELEFGNGKISFIQQYSEV